MICQGHTDTVDNCMFSSDGKLIATGSMDSSVKIWDAVNGNMK